MPGGCLLRTIRHTSILFRHWHVPNIFILNHHRNHDLSLTIANKPLCSDIVKSKNLKLIVAKDFLGLSGEKVGLLMFL